MSKIDGQQCHFNMACAMFFAQIVVSIMVMAFCMCMIAFNEGKLGVFLPLMTSTASVWVPTPTPPSRKALSAPPSPQMAEPTRS